jgi:exopolyphosphatase/pppGpp-phosphohydrolase
MVGILVNCDTVYRMRITRGGARQSPPFGASDHELRVAAIAVRLFDLLAPLHGLGANYRTILKHACIVHDCAKPAGADGHHVRGAAMVLEDMALPLNTWQRRAVAFLVRYHRGQVPEIGKEKILVAGDGRRKLRVLLGMLRAADSLDSRRLWASVILLSLDDSLVNVRCFFEGDKSLAERRFSEGKFELLEDALGVRVRVKINSIGAGLQRAAA